MLRPLQGGQISFTTHRQHQTAVGISIRSRRDRERQLSRRLALGNVTDRRRRRDRAPDDWKLAGDQAGAGMVGEVRPEPFERDDHSITHP